ncbi:MAG: hypothetical protein H7330_07000, partial [Hymenobacteraceae bacterium]|nr:hypothetical protein [Hymenobacteraceae bacterium]
MSVFLNLKWKGVTPPDADALDFAPEEFKLDRESAALPAPSSPLLPEIAVFGGDRSPKQIAIELLQAAAEIEHQFIVQYQYAYYCGGIQSQSPTPAVFRPLFIITKEEAGHMITVQNLLRLLGQPPHLARLDTLTPDPNDLGGQVEPGDPIGADETASAVARPGSNVTKAEMLADPQQGLFLV